MKALSLLPLLASALLGAAYAQTAPALAAGPTLRVMTYNVRYDEPTDPFVWDKRREPLAALVNTTDPDILGVQEVLSHQVTDLAGALPGYAYVGQGRGPDNPRLRYAKKSGEWNPIFYKTSRLELQESGTFWLSDTPQTPGSFGPQFSLPRIATWAKFRTLPEGREILAVNTHFPHNDGAADQRAYAARVLLREIDALRGSRPVVLTGDFNLDIADPAEAAPAALLQGALSNTRAEAPTSARQGPLNTFFGFGTAAKDGVRLDYIWTAPKAAFRVTRHRVLDAHQGDYYFSDHLPVVADLILR